MGTRISRRALLAGATSDQARDGLAQVAVDAGVDPDRARADADAAVVDVFARAVPRDLATVDALLRQQVLHRVAAPGGRAGAGTQTGEQLARRAQRARVWRVARLGVAGALACALVVAGAVAVAGADRAGAAPAAPVVTAPPQLEPEPEPSATPTPRVLGPVTQVEGLPPAQPLVEGMLEAAGPGWHLVQLDAVADPDATHFYLMDPAGTLFQVPTELGRYTWYRDMTITDWLPGTRLVLTSSWWPGERSVVDLLTGERVLTLPDGFQGHENATVSVSFAADGTTDVIASWVWPTEDSEIGQRTVRMTLDGAERAVLEAADLAGSLVQQPVISEDGTRLVVAAHDGLRVVDAATFADVAPVITPFPQDPAACRVQRWLGQVALLLECTDGQEYPAELWTTPLDAGTPVRLSQQYSAAWPEGEGLALLEPAELSSTGPEESRWGYGLRRCTWDGACEQTRFAQTLAGHMVGVADGTLYAFDASHEEGQVGGRYVSVDLAGGQERTLLDVGPTGHLRAAVPWGVHGPSWELSC